MWKRMVMVVALLALFAIGGHAQVELTVWGHNHLVANDYFAALIDQYERENPHVTITMAFRPNEETLVALVGGAGPDIFEVSGPLAFARNGLAQPIDDDIAQALGLEDPLQFLDQYFPNKRDYITYNNQPVGIYREVNTFGIIVSHRAFDEAGYGTSQLRDLLNDWDSVIDISRRLTQIDESGEVARIGFFYPNWGGFWGGLMPLAPLVAQGGGALLSEDGREATLDTPAGRDALDVWRRLGEAQGHRIAHPGGFGGLITGETAMMPGSLWTPKTAVDDRGDSDEAMGEMALLPVPLMPGATERYATDEPLVFMVNKTSPHGAEAWKFLQWAYSGERLIGWFDKVGYFVPAYELQDYAISMPGDDAMVGFLREIIDWQTTSTPHLPAHFQQESPLTDPIAWAVGQAYWNLAPVSELTAQANQQMNSYLMNQVLGESTAP